LKIAMLVTITIPGQKKIVVEHRQVTVALKQSTKKHRSF
jgi:hypothetical protein